MDIVDRIKQLCSQNDVTMLELEMSLGFGRGILPKWRTHEPSSMKLAQVAKYFGVSIDWLLGVTTDKLSSDPDMLAIQAARDRMTPVERAEMMQILRIGFKEAFKGI